jgi:hypothetical protein
VLNTGWFAIDCSKAVNGSIVETKLEAGQMPKPASKRMFGFDSSYKYPGEKPLGQL